MSDWVEWTGGECPVAEGTEVHLRFRDGLGIAIASTKKEIWEHKGDIDDIIAYRVVEPQAHVMSYPQAQGEYDVDDHVRELQAEAQRLSAELTYRTQLAESIEWSLRGQLADKDAEIERLRKEYMTVEELAKRWKAGERFRIDEERLRKEREDESGGKKCPVVRASIGRDLLNARLNSVVADPLDHRLGLPQPDGEPVEPMSARKPYRWVWQG